MSVHEQFAEDLALYALGSLEGEERTALEKHLDHCPGCRGELEQLRGDMALLALSTAGSAPPRRVRQRLMDSVAMEPRHPRAPKRSLWWNWAGWAAAAAMFVVAILLWRGNSSLGRELAYWRSLAGQQTSQLQEARQIVETLTARDAMRVTLVSANAPPQPQGKAIYLRDRSSLIFLASNMPALPPNKAYELWLIPTQGAPIPAGVFKPDARGSATVIN
ncbi:MAG TPA: anti-sigma factor, partial [Terriglobales bacterium]